MACNPKCASCDGTGEITEQFQHRIKEKYTVRFADYSPQNRVTTWLLVANVVVFGLTELGPPEVRQAVMGGMINHRFSLQAGEVWRFITPLFLHGGWWHLILNCWFLWSYCPPLEGAYGRGRFVALYLVSGLCGNILSWLFVAGAAAPFAPDLLSTSYTHAIAGVGASSALFGIGAAYIGLHLRWGFFDRAQIRAWATYLGLFIVGGFLLTDFLPLDNWAHLGGALGGLAFAWLAGRPRGRG